MRALDIALLVVLALPLARAVVRPTPARFAVAAAAAVVAALVAAAQIVLEGLRWQLLPAYGVAAVLVLAALVRSRRRDAHPSRDSRGSRGAAAGGLLLLALAGVAAWALPVVALPAPSGPRPVGTTVVTLTDETRPEPWSDDPDDHRRVVVQAWYPARESTGGAPVVEQAAVVAALSDYTDLPAFTLGHLSAMRSHATTDAPLDEAGPYPVVVYSHSWAGLRTAQTTQMVELASHGYVVVAIEHPYAALVTVFPDGEVVPLEPAVLPSDASPAVYADASESLVDTFAHDIGFVVERLAELDDERFDGRLDLESLAVMGHSTGGGAAVLACATLVDCDAVIGLDPWVEPVPDDVVGGGLDVPMLSIRSQAWFGNGNDARLRRLHVASSAPARLLHIEGTEHRDFTLLSLLTPLAPELGISGSTDGRRTHAIVDASLVGFLDHVLRGGADAPGPPPSGFAALIDDGTLGGGG